MFFIFMVLTIPARNGARVNFIFFPWNSLERGASHKIRAKSSGNARPLTL